MSTTTSLRPRAAPAPRPGNTAAIRVLAGGVLIAVGIITAQPPLVVIGVLLAAPGVLWRYRIELAAAAIATPLLLALPGPLTVAVVVLVGVPATVAYGAGTTSTEGWPRWLQLVAVIGRQLLEPFERSRVRRRWQRACRRCDLWPPPRLRRVTRTPTGLKLQITTRSGVPVDWIARHSEHLATTFRARQIRVLRDAADAGRGVVMVTYTDPFAGNAGLPWPDRQLPQRSLWDPVPVGVDEYGRAVTVTLPDHNLILGGEPGAGKTVAMHLLVAACALDPNVRLAVLDGKEVDLVRWRPRCHRFAGADQKAATAALDDALEWMTGAYARLRELDREKVQPGDPLYVVVVDELAYYIARKDSPFVRKLRDLIARGRAAGVIVITATQRPGSDLIPTNVRDLIAYKLALRTVTGAASDMILGAGWAAEGHDASKIASDQRGVGLLLAEGGHPVALRTFVLDRDDVAAIATRTAPYELDEPIPTTQDPPVPLRSAPAGGETPGDPGEIPARAPLRAPVVSPLPDRSPPAVASPDPGSVRRPRNRTDLQLRVEAALLEDPARSDREIARLCGCDHKTVGAARRRLAA